ncbi:MAG: hypothetical protein Q4G30_05240 [Actinomycetaceae bacterium]|nr:hypothetical protein [Actinomycetaceae bacterium]
MPYLGSTEQHAYDVASRMVARACWLMSLEDAHVSDQTRAAMVADTVDMLLDWAGEIGLDSFRAGDFSARTVA